MKCTRNTIYDKERYDKLFGIKADENEENPEPLWTAEIVKSEAGENFPLKVSITPTKENSRQQKLEKAFDTAHDTRKFEIDKYWQRTAYFWAFITSVYVAYFHVLKEMFDFKHGSFVLVVISALALFFSFSWYLTSVGSKH